VARESIKFISQGSLKVATLIRPTDFGGTNIIGVCVVFSLLKDVAQICSKMKFTSNIDIFFYLILHNFFHNIKYILVQGGNKSCCIYIHAWITTFVNQEK
jgi:hypothetical protein